MVEVMTVERGTLWGRGGGWFRTIVAMARIRGSQTQSRSETKVESQADAKERNTRQRDAIRDAIARAGVPVSPKEILESAQSSVQGLGLATVYRTLKLLVESGGVNAVDIPGEGPRFELSGKGHHHHFYCRGCTRVFEVDGCPGNFAQFTPPKFKLEGHELMLFGKCDTCEEGPGETGSLAHAGSRACVHGDRCGCGQLQGLEVLPKKRSRAGGVQKEAGSSGKSGKARKSGRG